MRPGQRWRACLRELGCGSVRASEGAMARYHTNLAAEFYVLSCLHRLGLDAHLTLGNRKGVDIVVIREAGDAVTVEVKGLAGKYEWPAGNLAAHHPNEHFVVLVSFEGAIDDPSMPPPRAWVLPFAQVERFKKQYRTRTNISRSAITHEGDDFEDAWSLIAGTYNPPIAPS